MHVQPRQPVATAIDAAVAGEEECKLDNNETKISPPFCNPPR